jgi:TP901 family phage tail tape measure protein
MDKTLRLQVIFGAIDKLSAPLRAMTGGSKAAAKAIGATRKEVLGLERASAKLGKMRDLERASARTADQLGYARQRVDALKTAMAEATGPTGRLAAQLVVAEGRVARLEGTTQGQVEKLDRLGRELREAGVDTGHLADEERRLARETEAANKRLKDQQDRADRVARIKQLGGKVQATGGRIADAGQSATYRLTAPALALGAVSGRAFMAFEDQMASVSTLTDDTAASMGRMKAQVLSLSKRVPVQLQDLTGSLYNIRSAGIGAGQAMGVLEGAARLGVAGLGTTQQAADIATSAINAFGLKGKEANAVYDQVFKTVKYGKTTIEQLSQGFGGVAGTIANAGVKFDEFQASTAALTTSGLPAAQAYSQMRAAIAGLTRETKQSKKVFDALGANSFKDLVQKSGGMVGAFTRIRTELKGNDAQLLELLGSTEALNAVIGLTGNQKGVFTQALGDMRGGANAIDPAYAKKSAQDAAKLQAMKNKLQAAAIQIGAIVVPVFVRLGELAGRAADAFGRLSPEAQRTIVTIVAIAAAAGPVLMIVGNLVRVVGFLFPVLSKLGTVLRIAGSLFSGLGRAALRAGMMMLANPMVLAITALVVAIGIAGYLIWKNWDKIKAAFSAGIAFIRGLVGRFREAGANIVRGLIAGVGAMFGALKNKIMSLGKSAVGWFKGVLGIHSPSRVFAGLGGHMMGGLALGVDRAAKLPLERVRAAGQALTRVSAVSLAMASPTLATPAYAARTAAALPGTAPTEYHFHIKQQPGEDADALADRIMKRIEAKTARAKRGEYRDDE